MPRRLVQERMISSDFEWLFHGSASRAISAAAELLVAFIAVFCILPFLVLFYAKYA